MASIVIDFDPNSSDEDFRAWIEQIRRYRMTMRREGIFVRSYITLEDIVTGVEVDGLSDDDIRRIEEMDAT